MYRPFFVFFCATLEYKIPWRFFEARVKMECERTNKESLIDTKKKIHNSFMKTPFITVVCILADSFKKKASNAAKYKWSKKTLVIQKGG